MENKKVIAIIGCGRIVKNAHMPALSKMENVRIQYACDAIVEKAEQMKEEFGRHLYDACFFCCG